MDRDRERNAEDEEAPVPESGGWQQKLKLVVHYAFLAFAPVVSIVALVVALVASGHRSDQAQLGEANARIDKLEASLQASRAEVETLRLAMAHEKSSHGDERKKDEELNKKIIQNVSRLQNKLKIAPTVEEQLTIAAPAAVAASHVEGSVPVPVSAPPAVQAPAAVAPAQATAAKPVVVAPKTEKKEKASAAPAKRIEEKKKAPPAPAKKPAEKMTPQVKALKDAIDQYNKQ